MVLFNDKLESQNKHNNFFSLYDADGRVIGT